MKTVLRGPRSAPERVTVDVCDGIAHVRLARPAKLNGLDVPMLRALTEAAGRLRRDPDLTCVP